MLAALLRHSGSTGMYYGLGGFRQGGEHDIGLRTGRTGAGPGMNLSNAGGTADFTAAL